MQLFHLRHEGILENSTIPGDFVHFKGHVPLRHLWVGTKQWRYYDYGPRSVPALVCLGGTPSTAEVFYKIVMSLSAKGYRVIAVDAPPVWSHQEWISSFEKFLDQLDVHHVHLYGTSLGGFLAQLFAQHRPRRVKSLLLSNTFLDTHSTTWSPLLSWTPEFILKRYILTGIRHGPQEPLIADSIDFVVAQLETLSRDELASRLTLNTTPAAVGQIILPDSCITLMDTNDYSSTPQSVKDQVAARYPGARRALLKSGGDFPFLSRAAEVTLHAQLHLRRVGVEAAVEASSIPSTGSGSGGDSAGDEPQYEGRSSEKRNNNKSGGSRNEPSTSPASDQSFSPSTSDSFKRLSESQVFELHLTYVLLLLVSNLVVQQFVLVSSAVLSRL